MKKLHEILKREKYKKVKFKITKTQHLLIKAKINGVEGHFILDTGASSSCVSFENIELFLLNAEDSNTKASGAGATGIHTLTASQNAIQLGSWKNNDFNIIIFDMTHVNEALTTYKVKNVAGIIGADVLLKGKAIIDYYNKCLYLR